MYVSCDDSRRSAGQWQARAHRRRRPVELPMHPQVVLPQGGECPVCKMQLVQIPGTPASAKPEDDRLLLAVPVTAVLDSGMRKLVYVEKAKGEFVTGRIVSSARAPMISILCSSGLKEGDKVAVRGNFLLDCQFQIQRSAEPILRGRPGGRRRTSTRRRSSRAQVRIAGTRECPKPQSHDRAQALTYG